MTAQGCYRPNRGSAFYSLDLEGSSMRIDSHSHGMPTLAYERSSTIQLTTSSLPYFAFHS